LKKIGFIGLGNMGKLMTSNLLQAGFEVTVYDIRKEETEKMAAKGAKTASSLKELGERSDIVFVMVLNFKQAQSVTMGAEGVIGGMKKGSVLIVTSTIAPSETLAISECAAERGIEMLDAPVSGGMGGAAERTLVIMAAGKQNVFDQCKDVLLTIGKNTVFVGGKIGMGQTVKAVIQLLVSVHTAVTGEALVLAQKAGIDMDLLLEVISKSAGASFMFNQKGSKILDRDWETKGALDIQIKDLDICMKMSRELDVPLFFSSLARDLFIMAEGMGHGREDLCAVAKVYEAGAKTEIHRLK
jgi:3-hydroxyisobutyrate dehydrogenase-like beta-hydroxyacid dehydrogenase